MNDKENLSFHDGEEEEFHITDEDIDRELKAMEMEEAPPLEDPVDEDRLASESAVGKTRFSKFKQLKRKHWIVIAIVIIVLLFGLLKIFGDREASSFDQITPITSVPSVVSPSTNKVQSDLTKTVLKAAPSDNLTVSAKQPAPLLTTPTLTTNHAVSPTSDNVSVTANHDKDLIQVLDAIQQQNKLLTQQLTQLSQRVQGLETSFDQSNQAVEGLSQKIVTMTSDKKAPLRSAPPPPAAVNQEPAYTVEAVVPQRAWLQTAEGTTITAMIGDNVPGLGTIVAIDPYSGNVTTSSGTIIKYAS